jgi:hypothetical protein
MVKYASRETVTRALDAMETTAAYDQIDRALESASRTIEGHKDCNRRFYPELVTLVLDWPDPDLGSDGYTLYLGETEIISVVTLTNGDGTEIDSADYNLEPANQGPPFDSIEIVLGSGSTLTAPSGTFQQAITAAVVRGYRLDQRPAGALAAAVGTTTATSITVTDGHAVGVGDLLTIGTERLEVTGRALVDTGETLTATIDAEVSDRTVAVSDGTAFVSGEEITVDAETMLITSISGDNLAVRRRIAGSQLAAHLSTTAVYASRALTVARGFGGTTAATHSLAAPITAQVYPEPVVTAVVAMAMAQVLNEQSGWARGLGSGESVRSPSGVGVVEARADARAAVGRGGRLFV